MKILLKILKKKKVFFKPFYCCIAQQWGFYLVLIFECGHHLVVNYFSTIIIQQWTLTKKCHGENHSVIHDSSISALPCPKNVMVSFNFLTRQASPEKVPLTNRLPDKWLHKDFHLINDTDGISDVDFLIGLPQFTLMVHRLSQQQLAQIVLVKLLPPKG